VLQSSISISVLFHLCQDDNDDADNDEENALICTISISVLLQFCQEDGDNDKNDLICTILIATTGLIIVQV